MPARSINIKAKRTVVRKESHVGNLCGQTKEDRMSTENKVLGAQEDSFTGLIESKTSHIPSSAFFGQLGSMAISAIFKLSGKDHAALFVGQWTAPFLLLGIYNKLVKQLGSDADTRESERPLRTQAAKA
jgi:hypothetical protein